jgi:hypothetical protein
MRNRKTSDAIPTRARGGRLDSLAESPRLPFGGGFGGTEGMAPFLLPFFRHVLFFDGCLTTAPVLANNCRPKNCHEGELYGLPGNDQGWL